MEGLIDAFAIGFIVGLVLDTVWWARGFDKYDKHLEWHEHYHVGLELGILGVILNQPLLTGFMVAFILAEWTQENKFALGSNHFGTSTIVGIILFAVYLMQMLYITYIY